MRARGRAQSSLKQADFHYGNARCLAVCLRLYRDKRMV